ncbi:MAG: hypothetical protein Q8P81_02840 [Nanoarchaeota archaeon]|nr:hypothetical protein [Nanoarchaeota archaeon]
MKKVVFFALALMSLSFVSAINIDVQKISSGEVLIAGLDEPIIFSLSITNNGPSGNFNFYNLVSFAMTPESVYIAEGDTEAVQLELTPLGKIDERGSYAITYYIKSEDGTQEQRTLTFKIIELEEAFTISSSDLDPESTSVDVSIKNNENFDFGNIGASFESPFFKFEREFSLGPQETKTFNVGLDSNKSRGLVAGYYTMTAEVSKGDVRGNVDGVVRFIEKDIVTTVNSEFGFLVDTQIIEKTNDGNVVQKTETVVKKNIIPRLFTSLEPKPDLVERKGTTIYYTWINEIKPGEKIQIMVKTNWLFPFIILLLLISIVVLTKRYSKTNLVLKKKITFVRAKGGEFALKVSVLVSSKKYLERVNVVDRLPPLVDVYERFGGDQPSKIDRKNKRIEWNFEKLEAGEIRVLSYVIYSKVGVLGRFALPSATAIYEKEGEIHETESNRTFFVAEQRSKKEDSEEI